MKQSIIIIVVALLFFSIETLNAPPAFQIREKLPYDLVFSNQSLLTTIFTVCSRSQMSNNNQKSIGNLRNSILSFFYYNTYPLKEIILVDRCSIGQQSKQFLISLLPQGNIAMKSIRIIQSKEGFLSAISKAFQLVSTKYVYLLPQKWITNEGFGLLDEAIDVLQYSNKTKLKFLKSPNCILIGENIGSQAPKERQIMERSFTKLKLLKPLKDTIQHQILVSQIFNYCTMKFQGKIQLVIPNKIIVIKIESVLRKFQALNYFKKEGIFKCLQTPVLVLPMFLNLYDSLQFEQHVSLNNNNMKLKNSFGNNGVKLESKKGTNNDYRKKLDSLEPGNVLLPDSSSTDTFKLRNIKPPIKNLRMPIKNNQGSRLFPFLCSNQLANKKKNELENQVQENQRSQMISSSAKKNGELLDYMIEILRSKDQKQLAPIRINTEPESFNEFANIEYSTSKNSRGPLLDPKISKFYEKKYFRRQIFSQQKQRKYKLSEGCEQRLSVSKNKLIDDTNLITFYNQNKKGLVLGKADNSQNQFMQIL